MGHLPGARAYPPTRFTGWPKAAAGYLHTPVLCPRTPVVTVVTAVTAVTAVTQHTHIRTPPSPSSPALPLFPSAGRASLRPHTSLPPSAPDHGDAAVRRAVRWHRGETWHETIRCAIRRPQGCARIGVLPLRAWVTGWDGTPSGAERLALGWHDASPYRRVVPRPRLHALRAGRG